MGQRSQDLPKLIIMQEIIILPLRVGTMDLPTEILHHAILVQVVRKGLQIVYGRNLARETIGNDR